MRVNQIDDAFYISSDEKNVSKKLKVGNYAASFDGKQYYLKAKEDFSLPQKIYGRSIMPERIIKTYKQLGHGIGVLLSGPKGTGKTVESKIVCRQSDMPVVMINTGFAGSAFSNFIEGIETPSIILIDEFEKVYEKEEERNFFLSMLDGTAKSRHLYLLTSNNPNIGEFFTSRPGRIRYHKQYEFLTDELTQEIVEDKLAWPEHKEAVLRAFSTMHNLSIDVVCSILEEVNLWNEPPSKFMSFFNVKNSRPSSWSAVLETKRWFANDGLKDKEMARAVDEAVNRNRGYGNNKEYDAFVHQKPITYASNYVYDPISDEEDNQISVRANYLKDESGQFNKEIDWDVTDIVRVEESRRKIIIESKDGDVLTLSRAKTPEYTRRGF